MTSNLLRTAVAAVLVASGTFAAHAQTPALPPLVEQTRIYPLYEVEKNVKPMEFPNGSGQRVTI